MGIQINEIFESIEGEGIRTGYIATFIRTQFCNLKCSYCDTKWANEPNAEYKSMSVNEICEFVKNTGVKNVTLTGGEPLLQDNIQNLIEKLILQGNRVEIETNGSISLKKFALLKNRPVFTMDYKLPSSNMEKYMGLENFAFLNEHDTVKFVSGSIEDLKKAEEIIEKYNLTQKCNVYISPVFGKINPADIVDFMIKRNLNGVRLQLQLHKFIWEPDRRGV